jgi:menaquinone-9 beta-reductase
MDSCDVLIVGGGPAGSSCAWALRSSGLRVAVVDKARFPRNKVCGGWITPQVLEALEIDPQQYARGRTCQPITGFSISTIGGREIKVPYPEAVSYGIRRCEFDEYLLRRSGAQVCEGFPISSVERQHDGWIINGKIKTSMLIGAGGHFCPIARYLGCGNGHEPVVAQEAEFQMDEKQAAACAIREELPELYFCNDLQGYGWCFRKENFLNVGLGRLDQRALPQHVNEFVKFLRATGKLAFDLPQKMSGHAYFLAGHSGRKVLDDAVLLIGDAAGLAYVQSGEGIRPAVESGLLAAKVIDELNGCYTRERLQAYGDLLDERFARKTTLASRLPRRLRNAIGRLLLQTHWFCRRMVVEEWFLHEGK